MEILSGFSAVDEPMELPPGFRFHPTDEELIVHYLSPKVLDGSFTNKVIGDVDLNKVEPWDLPWMAKMGEKEWYFFCLRDRKYPTGLRTNRATDAGYWKATGKDKEIYHAKTLVGMKKTLVFYRGRAPRGEKSNWVMHEYRLEGKNSMHNLPKTAKNEWVICRIFKKCSGGKKVHISGMEKRSCDLPPLMDLSSDENLTRNTSTTAAEGSHVTCFSNSKENPQDKFVQEFSSSSSKNRDFSPFSYNFPNTNSIFSSQSIPCAENLHYTDSVSMQDQSILRLLLENNGAKPKEVAKPEFSHGMNVVNMSSQMEMNDHLDQEFPAICTGQVDLDCLWNY